MWRKLDLADHVIEYAAVYATMETSYYQRRYLVAVHGAYEKGVQNGWREGDEAL